MKVILLEEIRGKGGEGDVVEVATGYAVNFLFPKKLAIQATSGNLKQLELRKHNIAKRESDRLDTADKLLAALEGQAIRIGAKVGEEGQLFGSVTTTQVAAALSEKLGVDIDRKRIDLHGLIKTAGEHPATVSIYREVKANVIVEVVDEKILAAAGEAADTTVEASDEGASVEDILADVEDILEAAEEELEEFANKLVEIVDASEDGDDEAVAEAAEEILEEAEGLLDVAVAEAIAEEIEEKLESED
jgi:large subunit ribosomal protein L9